MMRPRELLLGPVSLAALAAFLPAPQDLPAGWQDARSLFVTNCASCHGEEGDGQGVTDLDRKARSFQDGGFSYGNTPETVFRTITYGIPGTPMPSFESALTEEQRRRLADYVLGLGPERLDVERDETWIEVGERPLVVRGLLPPLADGLPERPRGLLVGHPSGLTFEYRVDDVRLLAVRQGAFVERTDWIGRGGTPVLPRGQVVLLLAGGDPRGAFTQEGAVLRARMAGTRVHGTDASVRARLVRDGEVAAHFSETVRPAAFRTATGIARRIEVRVGPEPVELAVLRLFHREPDPVPAQALAPRATAVGREEAWGRYGWDERLDLHAGLRAPAGLLPARPGLPRVLALPADSVTVLELVLLVDAKEGGLQLAEVAQGAPR